MIYTLFCSCRKTRPFRINRLGTLCAGAKTSNPLFSVHCALFCKTGGGYPTLPRRASLPPSYAPHGASIPCGLTRLRILPVTTGVYYESVWQLCCLGEFLVISMIHLHSSEVVARGGLD